jgi:transposase-like protein
VTSRSRPPWPIYAAIGATLDGEKHILGLWATTGGEGSPVLAAVMPELKNRGVGDVCMVVCDGFKGLAEAIATTWLLAVTQTRVVHLLRAWFRYAPYVLWRDRGAALDLGRKGCELCSSAGHCTVEHRRVRRCCAIWQGCRYESIG